MAATTGDSTSGPDAYAATHNRLAEHDVASEDQLLKFTADELHRQAIADAFTGLGIKHHPVQAGTSRQSAVGGRVNSGLKNGEQGRE